MQMEGENDETRHIRLVTVKAASFEQVLIWIGTQSKKAMVSRFAKKLGPGEIFYLTVQSQFTKALESGEIICLFLSQHNTTQLVNDISSEQEFRTSSGTIGPKSHSIFTLVPWWGEYSSFKQIFYQ